jgi:hypothetical protein
MSLTSGARAFNIDWIATTTGEAEIRNIGVKARNMILRDHA